MRPVVVDVMYMAQMALETKGSLTFVNTLPSAGDRSFARINDLQSPRATPNTINKQQLGFMGQIPAARVCLIQKTQV